jgi:N,N'-diacetyllegionaminate synthase
LEQERSSTLEKSDSKQFDDLKIMFGKSLAVNKSISAGHILTIADLESKKPGNKGIPARNFSQVLGKPINRDLHQWDFLDYTDISL